MDSLHKALKNFDHATTINADYPYIYFQRALTYLKLADTTASMNDYNRVISLDSNNALTYYNRALLKAMRKNYKGALDDYDKVIQINPRNVYAYYNRGVIALQTGRPREAVNDYSRALEIFPDFIGAYINRSYARERLGDKKGAQQDHNRAMKIISSVNGKGQASRELFKKYADSSYFNNIIEFEADFMNGEMRKGRVQFRKINITPKPDFFVAYAFDLPDSVTMQYQKVEYYNKKLSLFNAENHLGIKLMFTTRQWPVTQNKALAKLRELDKSLILAGDTSGAYFLKGVVNSMLQNYFTAIGAYDSCLDINPNALYAYFNRAATRTELKESIYAERQYSNAITISRSNFQPNKPVGDIPPPNHKKSLADYQKVLSLDSTLPYTYYNLANLKLHLKKYQRAIDDYSTAIRLNPKMAEAYYNRALILIYLKENNLACKDLSKAGELGIDDAYAVIKQYCGH